MAAVGLTLTGYPVVCGAFRFETLDYLRGITAHAPYLPHIESLVELLFVPHDLNPLSFCCTYIILSYWKKVKMLF